MLDTFRTAERYFGFAERCQEDAFYSWLKMGWGSAVLHALTDNEKYLRVADQVADYWTRKQADNGCWFLADMPFYFVLDRTAEHVIWLSEILGEIESLVREADCCSPLWGRD
jgi:hypothetical protein